MLTLNLHTNHTNILANLSDVITWSPVASKVIDMPCAFINTFAIGGRYTQEQNYTKQRTS